MTRGRHVTGTSVRRRRRVGPSMRCTCTHCGESFVAHDPCFCPCCGTQLSDWFVADDRPLVRHAWRVRSSAVWAQRTLDVVMASRHDGYLTTRHMRMTPDMLADLLWDRRLHDEEPASPYRDDHDPMGLWRLVDEDRFVYSDLYVRPLARRTWVDTVSCDGVTLLCHGRMTDSFATYLDDITKEGHGNQ